ncbi:MFS transporter, partial [bacterium]|nr:MFS transporter [bacterium]
MSENIDSIREQILKGRKKFIAMAITYFLGVFNDNFFKQVIMLLALSYGKNKLQGWATVVFTLPYLIVAAPAGWLADKYSKRNVIIGAKWLELFAMIAGALGILYFNGNAPIMSFNWILILAMLGIMGLQSSIFSPALNGSIPELYPKSYIQTANGIVKLVTTFAILSGIAIAGIVLDYGIESQLAQTYNKIETLNTKYASVKNKDILRTLLSETIKSSLDEYSKFKNGAVIRIKPENDTFIIKMHDSKEKNVQTGIIKLDVEQCNMIVNSIKKGNKSNLNKVALAILVVAILGVLISYGSPKRKGAGSTVAFPWKGPWNSLKDLWEIKKDTLLITTIFACTFFWFIGMLQVLLINQMGVDQFKWSKTATSMLLVAQMIGVAIGALLASRFSKGDRWYSILQPALLMMAVFYGLLGSIVFFPKSIQYHLSVLFLTLAGVGGGLYLIPLESFLQIRPDAARKGKVIAAANFAALGGSMIAGPFYNLLVYINFQPTNCFALMGIFSIIVMFLLFWALLLVEVKEDRVYNGGRNFMDRCLILIGRILLSFRYRIKVKGMEQIVQKGTEKIIFLPNHIALVDPAIIAIALYNNFAPRSIGDSANISNPLVNWITKRMGVRPIPDMSQSGVDAKIELDKIMKKTTEGIKQGDNLMLYPSGHIKQTIKEEIGARSGVSILLNDVPDARIVLVRQNGLWGSSFSHGATGKKPDLLRGFSNGIKTIFRNLIFFVPKREILVELIEPENFPYGKEKLEMNQFMEQIFNEDAWPNTYVPYHFISKEKKHQLEEPIEACIEGDVNSVPEATKQIVIEYLQELVGIDDIRPEQKLAIDLSMDSLSMVEVLSWLEQEFGFPQGDTESYTTVGDILLGAIGQGVSGKEVSLKPVSKKWFSYDDDSSDVSIADGGNIAEVFLNQAANSPQKVIFADQTTGEKTYSDVITGIYALKPVIESLEGENLGLMFPASVGANIFYLATIFSGKTPVMVNWTTGIKNIIFSLNNVGVKHIITSKLLVSKLQSQGINF